MNIIISNSNNAPIYEQIYTQIRDSIILGHLNCGDMLPSIRSLAKDLKISVITTKRAYEELEREGFINTVAGKGCYVAMQDLDLVREQNVKKIESHINEVYRLSRLCNLTENEIIQMFKVIKEEQY